jgi:hypothetical protein
MGRRSKVKDAPDPIRSEIERMLRADKFSLDEMRDLLIRQFPDLADKIPTRSSLGRYRQSMGQMLGRMRDIDSAARVVVAELGENPDERAGALLTQTITALATHAALKAGENEDGASIGEVKDLARAAKNVMDARRVGLKERQEIEAAARDKLKREQQAKLGDMAKHGTISQDTLDRIRREVYGIGV